MALELMIAFLLFGGLGLALAFTFREPREQSKKEHRYGGAHDREQSQEQASSDAKRENPRTHGWSKPDDNEHDWQHHWSDKARADFNPEPDLERQAREAQQRANEQAQFQRARGRAEQRQRQHQAQAQRKAEEQRGYTVKECRSQVQKHHPDKGGDREQFELWMTRLAAAREV